MRLLNFSKISELCDYSLKNRENRTLLSELATLIKNEQLTNGWLADNTEKIQQLIEIGFITKKDIGSVVFIDQLHFEFFYSFKFINENFKDANSFCAFVNILTEKVSPRANRNQAIKLSNDFQPICYIVINNLIDFNILTASSDLSDACFQEMNLELDKALPYFNSSASIIYSYLKLILTKDYENSFIHSIERPLNKHAAIKPEVAIELLAHLKNDTDERIKNLIPTVILGLSRSKGNAFVFPISMSQLKSSDKYDINYALFELSRLSFEKDEWDEFSIQLLPELDRIENGDSETYKSRLPAIYLQHFSMIPSSDKFLINYSLSENLQYQLAIARGLFQYDEMLIDKPCFETLIINSANWNYNNAALSNSMEMVIRHLVDKSPELAIKFWNAWILNEKNDINKLTIFKHKITNLYAKNPAIIEQWITLSFRSANGRFHEAMFVVISELYVSGFKRPSLNKDLLNTYNFYEIKYILFKIFAHIHSKEPLESLVFSMLNKEPFDYNVAQLIANAFTQYICYHYGGSYSYLKKQESSADEELLEVLKAILKSLDEYNHYLKDIPKVNELKWQNKQGVSFVDAKMKRISKEFHEGMEKNLEDSIRAFAKNINLKGGKKFFSKHKGKYTTPTPLQNMGTSFELPVGQFIDPVKEIMKRIEWRNYKLKE